jgi:aryl-alcohol dehydrogenase-like predicted oxidoreductase
MTDQTISLGKSPVQVGLLGTGTWQWGDRGLWGFGQGYSEDDIRAAFQASLQASITFFDTAEGYGWGRSERFLGQFAREAGHKISVATKFIPFPWRLTPQSLVRALQASLERLGMGSIDLYQIHVYLPFASIETLMNGLADAVEDGLTRAVGVSNYNALRMSRAHAALAKRGVPLASNQVEYSLLQRDPERNGLVKVCQELGVTIIAYSPIGKGLLSGKYTPENPPPGQRGKRFDAEYLKRIMPLISLLRQTGQDHGGKTPSQVALNWVICKGALPIPGAKNAHQVQENAGALGWRLSEDEVAGLDEASEMVGSRRT